MFDNLVAARAILGVTAAALLLSACARGDKRPGTSVDRPQTTRTAPNTRSNAYANVRPPEALWHLRAGLNVAALICRGKGRKSVKGPYRRMLSKHRAVLKTVYRSEERRYGKSGLDTHQTKLYNRFANQRSPVRFCRAAADIAGRANNMDSARLAALSPKLLRELRSKQR